MNVAEAAVPNAASTSFHVARGVARERAASLRAAIEPADKQLHETLQKITAGGEDEVDKITREAGDAPSRDVYIAHLEKYAGKCEAEIDKLQSTHDDTTRIRKAKARDTKIIYGLGGALAASVPFLAFAAARR